MRQRGLRGTTHPDRAAFKRAHRLVRMFRRSLIVFGTRGDPDTIKDYEAYALLREVLDRPGAYGRIDFYGQRCWICGAPFLHMDHVKPQSRGGPNLPCNLRPICVPCNSRKNALWPLTKRRLAEIAAASGYRRVSPMEAWLQAVNGRLARSARTRTGSNPGGTTSAAVGSEGRLGMSGSFVNAEKPATQRRQSDVACCGAQVSPARTTEPRTKEAPEPKA